MKYNALCCILFLGLIARAQDFAIRSRLMPVPATGFYQLSLSPELGAHTRADLADIRILDEKGKQVPYLVRRSGPVYTTASFIEFPILAQKTDSSITELEIEVKTSTAKELSLLIANTAVQRQTSLSGSSDRQHWFIIDENISIYNTGQSVEGGFVQTLRIPEVNYHYLRLKISNSHSDPLNILKAGVFSDTPRYGPIQYIANPDPAFFQHDSNDRSYIRLNLGAPYNADRIRLSVNGPKFFHREVIVSERVNAKETREVARFYLTSLAAMDFVLPGIKQQWLELEIINRDNPPLKIEAIQTYQVQTSLVAWLEQGKSYSVVAESPEARSPQYDLAAFRDRIPAQVASLSMGPILPNDNPKPEVFSKKYWLWIIIVAGIALLGFLSFRLMADMKKTIK